MADDATFGDFEDDDAFDTAPADPEATARIFVDLLIKLSGDNTRKRLDDLHPFERALYVFAFAALLERLRREGAS
jgi:hypothetical protein